LTTKCKIERSLSMTDPNIVVVRSANGKLEADMLKLFLESQGLHPILAGESVGNVYGLQITPLGLVDIFVLEEEEQEALRVLEKLDRGDFEQANDSLLEDPSNNDPQE
jgi:hypothetical protein